MNTFLAIPLAQVAGEQVVDIILFVVGLVLVWIVLRFILGVAMRIFRIGCMLLLVMGVLLVVLRVIG
jgi:hypothetical protein